MTHNTIHKSVSDVYNYIGKHIHLINGITGMNQLKIIIVIIAVILQLNLAHYLIKLQTDWPFFPTRSFTCHSVRSSDCHI